ncbi:MAG: phosphate ABC transporter permease PstA [Oscillospiraceae bacterium]|jgi:phosphate transport system permease protein|nr:phosphate ABC transporter permease PstA [Oscillospiraceae bacterium]
MTAARKQGALGKVLRRKKPADWARFLFTWGAGIATLAILLYLIVFILIKGVPHITPSLFAPRDPDGVSLFPALVTTVLMVALTLLVAAPLGVFTAIYMVEYAYRGSRLVRIIRMTAETLSGIPSIVYGLFGYIFFAGFLGFGKSILTGCLTLAIMILPLIMRTTEESLKAIPDAYREGSFGLGAGRVRTVFRVILPSATPGIFAGVVLAVGRIVGETAALIFSIGDVLKLPDGLLSQGRTLAMHVLKLSGQGFHRNEAYATAVILLVLVVGINMLSSKIERGFLAKLK